MLNISQQTNIKLDIIGGFEGRDFEKIDKFITEANIIFRPDNKEFEFSYKENDKFYPIKMEELIHLNNEIFLDNKININNSKESKNINIDKLLFFRNIISNIRIIYDNIDSIILKGCYLPILINIEIKYPEANYFLNNEKKKYDIIKEYILNVKSNYENQLHSAYKNKKYLRFIYGKLFKDMIMYSKGNCQIEELIRYILNKTESNAEISDAIVVNKFFFEENINEYEKMSKESFDNIEKNIISLFLRNNLDIAKHYKNMLIKEKNKYKGIYIKKCRKISTEEYMFYSFYEKLGKFPIAQNILIISKETSIEEISSFLYRAILCDYNTLFMVKLNESLTDDQYNILYTYIGKILTIKFEKYKNENKYISELDKLKTSEYIDSFIVFTYDENQKNNNIIKLEKYINGKLNKLFHIKENIYIKDIDELENEIIDFEVDDIKYIPQFENIKVISSDVCGLGKTFKIKNMIKRKSQKYYHFPLGGVLSKKIISEKIKNLFEKIKNDETEKNDIEYKDISIHIDLSESSEISLINEFLFSFILTKFYINNDNIIHIPNDINIYIEIPNCFYDYLSKIKILNLFKIENIVLGDLIINENKNKNIINVPMEKLELDSSLINIFKEIMGKLTNEEIEEFIKKNIDIKYYSFYQLQIFIKLFISQFSKFKGKIKIVNSFGKDITEEYIKNFAKSTKYFTNGAFAKLLLEKNKNEKDKINSTLKAYEEDIKKTQAEISLSYINEKTKKYEILFLPSAVDEETKTKSKEVDIIYLLDATGSMGHEISALNKNIVKIYNDLNEKFKDLNLDFNFGAVFYRDIIDSPKDKNEYFQLTNDVEKLKDNISTIKPYGGGDLPEDWVTGYNLALNEINWRNGFKLIIHIADAGAHGEEFTKGDSYPDQGAKLISLIKKCIDKILKEVLVQNIFII